MACGKEKEAKIGSNLQANYPPIYLAHEHFQNQKQLMQEEEVSREAQGGERQREVIGEKTQIIKAGCYNLPHFKRIIVCYYFYGFGHYSYQ